MKRVTRILALETSSQKLSLALGDDSDLLEEFEGPLQWRHAETLFKAMRHLLARKRWPVQSLTGVCVSTGPGSFTGIRIGLAAARALGQGLRIPVTGVSALRAIAWGAALPDRPVAGVINALRGDVFFGVFRRPKKAETLETLIPEERLPAVGVVDRLRPWPSACVAGDALRLYRPDWKAQCDTLHFLSAAKGFPTAGAVLALGRSQLVGPRSYKEVLPLYLRQAAAQERAVL